MKRKARKKELDLNLTRKRRSRNDWSKEERRRRNRKNESLKTGILIGIIITIIIETLIGLGFAAFKHCRSSMKVSDVDVSQENKKETQMETIEVEEERVVYEEVLIAEYMIDNPASNANRNNNLAQAARDINCANNPIFKDGYILKTGEKFSWLEIVGDPTEERGYLKAGEMENGGQSTTGIGGGICQDAISVYNAILQTEQSLDPLYFHVEHHSGKVSYVKPERGDKELTVTYKGNRDFYFISTLPNTIRIYLIAEGGKVHTQIYEFRPVIRKIKRRVRVPKKGA